MAQGTEREAISWLRALAAGEDSLPASVVEGIVTECFVNEIGMMRFKITHLERALRILMRLNEQTRQEIFGRLVGKVSSYRVRYDIGFQKDKEKSVHLLERVIEGTPDVARELMALKQAIEALEEPEWD